VSNDLLQKVVDTTQIGSGGGGILQPEQANKFIDYMWDATVLGPYVRRIRMRSDTVEVDKIDLGSRIARHAHEGVDDHELARPVFTKIELRTQKIRLDWELTTEGLEDNLAGDDLEDHIARLMANQLGNDLEDLAINGDTEADMTEPGWGLIKAFDGYKKLGEQGGYVLDAQGARLHKGIFNQMYKSMPRKFRQRRADLRFFTSSGLIQDYVYRLTESGWDIAEALTVRGNLEPGGPAGQTALRPFGIPLVEVPLQREDLGGDYAGVDSDDLHGYVTLTFPKNYLWGVKREVKVYREFKPKKDAIEYTVFTRVGVQIDNLEAHVVTRNVKQHLETLEEEY
jgi:hypothetical protein